MNRYSQLPEPALLKEAMRVQAVLNVILCEEEWLRRHHFIPDWQEGVSLAKIDNGAGDHLILLFSSEGAILKGFDHESGISPYAQEEHQVWSGIYETVPNELASLLADESIAAEDATFCIWRKHGEACWQKGTVNIPAGESDGSDFLLGMICLVPDDFVSFANDYFEVALPVACVEKAFAGASVTIEFIQQINPACDAARVYRELVDLRLLPTDLAANRRE